MAEHELDPSIDEQEVPDTPEDVAILYSWANMHGAKYRDFSASRREYRAQMRARAMEAQREAELKAAQEREEAARREEESARRAAVESSSSRRAALELEEARMRAEIERVEAQRHAEAAELARQAAEDAEREAEGARLRAREQAMRYAESDQRRRAYAGPQPGYVPGEIDDPYHYAGHVDPVRLAGSGVRPSGIRSSGFRSVSGKPSWVSTSQYRSDAMPNPNKLIRDDVSEARRRAEGEAYAYAPESDYNRDGRFEIEKEGVDSLQDRHENRLFRAPSDRRFVSSASRPVYRADASQNDPNVIRPRHEDLHLPVPENVYDRIGQQQLEHLEEESHRRKIFNALRHLERDVDPTVEKETESRPTFEDKSNERAREDAEARRRLHEEVEQELHVDIKQQEAEEAARIAADQRRQARILREDARLSGERQPQRNTERDAQTEREQAERERVRAEEALRMKHEQERALAEENARREREAAQREEAARENARRAEVERMRHEQEEKARAEEARIARERDDVRREAERRERSKMDLRESMMTSAYRSASGAVPVRTNSGMSAIRPAAGASGIRPASGAYPLEGASGRPAWLHSENTPAPQQAGAMSDTLQHSRERVAARWFALKELMGQSSGDHAKAEVAKPAQREVRTPTLCIVSMAGGVGKTSMVATLGRTLSAMGEKVLLADTGSHGLLPYYFGARDLRPGVVRTFSPPAGSPDAPVYMVNYDTDTANYDVNTQDHIYNELQRASQGIHRVLLDLNMQSAWMVRRMAKNSPAILVPLGPDMNSVLGIQTVERILSGLTDADGHVVQPYYVLNQFDASLPLHLDVREALRQKLGDRLLPVVIRRAPAVAEALAEGMTVMDYAPNSSVTEDYTQLATWVRNLTAPATATFRGMRWSEG